jgi:hypothetical protein
MLKTLLIQESEKQEYYTVDINGKVLHVYIEKGDEGAVFTIEDHGVYLTDPERSTVFEELKVLSIDFSSRRIFGTYRPKETNSARASNSRGVANRYSKRFLKL